MAASSGQRGDADGRARVLALLAEDGDHHVGSAVHHLRAVEEARRRVHEAAEPHHPRHLVEIADGGLDLGEQIDRTGARRFLPVLDGDPGAQLALGDKLAVVEADLAGHHEQIAGAHEGDVVGDRSGRRREHNTELAQFFLNVSGHSHPPGCWFGLQTSQHNTAE